MFAADCAVLLGRTLGEILAMDSAEVAFWSEYRNRRGFPMDRLEIVGALGAAANCQVHGAKAKASDFIPRFGERAVESQDNLHAQLRAFLGGIKRAKTYRIPRPDRKRQAEAAKRPAERKPDATTRRLS